MSDHKHHHHGTDWSLPAIFLCVTVYSGWLAYLDHNARDCADVAPVETPADAAPEGGTP